MTDNETKWCICGLIRPVNMVQIGEASKAHWISPFQILFMVLEKKILIASRTYRNHIYSKKISNKFDWSVTVLCSTFALSFSFSNWSFFFENFYDFFSFSAYYLKSDFQTLSNQNSIWKHLFEMSRMSENNVPKWVLLK